MGVPAPNMTRQAINLPDDWRAAIRETAAAHGLSVSRFLLQAAAARMPVKTREGLSELPTMGRPPRQ